MKVINASYKILNPVFDEPSFYPAYYYGLVEQAGRTCYKSESLITDESAEKFVRNIIKNGHEAMLEHVSMTVKFIVDRGVSHEIVRHRLASFAQESTRYCDYSKDKFDHSITFIRPYYLRDKPSEAYSYWLNAMNKCEDMYFALMDAGCTPQEARAVLPNSTKTELIMTANIREWRHFFKLRAAGITGKPHPQMLEVAVPLLKECINKLPAFFDDIIPMEV